MQIRLLFVLALALTMLPVVVSAQAPASQHKAWEDPVKLDSRGYIRQWLVLGPINFGDKYNAENIEKDQIKDETKIAPKAGDKIAVETQEGQPGSYKTVPKELTWKAVKSESHDFNLNKILDLDASDGMGGYAVAYLEVPEEMKGVKFSLGSNDNCKVILNGKRVHAFIGGRQLEEDLDVVPELTLQKGINVVIFKIWNDSNDWSGCLRVLNNESKPLMNVMSRLPK